MHYIFILHGSTSRRLIGPSRVVLFGLPTQCYLISVAMLLVSPLHKRCHCICACVTCSLRLDVSVIGWGFAWRREDVHYSSRFTTVCIEDPPRAANAHSIRIAWCHSVIAGACVSDVPGQSESSDRATHHSHGRPTVRMALHSTVEASIVNVQSAVVMVVAWRRYDRGKQTGTGRPPTRWLPPKRVCSLSAICLVSTF